MTRPHALALLLALALGCGGLARAGGDAEPEHEPAAADEGGSTGAAGHDGDADEAQDDEGASASRAVDPALEAAREAVDAAIAASGTRGENDRLAVAQARAELDAQKAELDARLASIDGLQTRIDELLGSGKIADDRHRERVSLLGTLVATMSPAAAATMLSQMSDAEAQDLLLSVAQADKRKAAKLFASMPAARAAAIGQRYLAHDPKLLDTGSEVATPPSPAAPAPVPAAPATPPAPATPTPQAQTPAQAGDAAPPAAATADDAAPSEESPP